MWRLGFNHPPIIRDGVEKMCILSPKPSIPPPDGLSEKEGVVRRYGGERGRKYGVNLK